MKTNLIRLIVILILSITLTNLVFAISQETSNGNQQSQTIILSIPNMTCGMCPITIKNALKKVNGVSRVNVSFRDKTAKVTFNPNKTNIINLMAASKDAGYPSKLIPK